MSKYFVIADTHFGHENILVSCNRPFSSVKEMNRTLIRNWTNTVSKNDTVFLLGDFSLKRTPIIEIAPLLNGNKILIRGNHDSYPNEFYRKHGFQEAIKYPILVEHYLLSHEPLFQSNTTPYFNFYGHVHNDPKYSDTATSKCVSAERINYTPFCFLEK